MRWTIAAMLIATFAVPAFAACPPGAYLWLGRNGVDYCRRDVVSPADGIEAGTRAATDVWNARVCEKIKPAPAKSRTDARSY